MKATFRRQFAVLGLLGLAATGCSTAHTGHVAGRVGSRTVDTSQVASYMNDLIADQKGAALADADKVTAERQILGFLVQHQVFTALAAKDGITASPSDIATALAGLGGADTVSKALVSHNLPQSLLPTLIGSLALQNNLVDKWLPIPDSTLQAAYQQQRATFQTVNVTYLPVTSQAQADQIAARVRLAPDTFDAVAKDVLGPSAVTTASGPLPLTQFAGDIGAKVWAAQVGDVLAVSAAGSWDVLLVTDHQDKTFAEAKPTLLASAHANEVGPAIGSHVSQLLATD
ncbi:MAG: hypothetical protein QOG52_531, partial [Frankiaceae bacterium]|nr:hypothetical protein [Frankiaceae bacterium]